MGSEEEAKKKIVKLYSELFKRSIPYLKTSKKDWANLNFDEFDMNFPTHFTLYKILNNRAMENIKGELNKQIQAKKIRDDFLLYYPRLRDRILGKEIGIHNQHPTFVEQQIHIHTNRILRIIGSDPLPIDPTFTLQEIFLPPSANYWPPSDEAKNKKGRDVRILPKLVELVTSCLEPILVYGEPGHGKTSTMYMLVHAIANGFPSPEDRPITLFYDFKRLGNLRTDLLETLRIITPFIKDISFFSGRHSILIFDGMDEHQISAEPGNNLIAFISQLIVMTTEVHKEQGDTKINLVFTGRSQFAKQNIAAFVTPFHLFEIKNFNHKQIDQWLSIFNKKKKYNIKKKDLIKLGLKNLIFQPILLTMMGLIHGDPDPEYRKEIPKSRASLYQKMISWTYKKLWQAYPKPHDFVTTEKDYFLILQAIAFVMFQHGKKYISYTELFEELRREKDFFSLKGLSFFEKDLEFFCREVAISFFFQGAEERTFVFIHQSFGDYLTIKAMNHCIKKILEKYNPQIPGHSWSSTSRLLYQTLGYGSLSAEDHLPFLVGIDDVGLTEKEFSAFSDIFCRLQQSQFMVGIVGKKTDPMMMEANILANCTHWLASWCHQLRKTIPFIEDGFRRMSHILDASYAHRTAEEKLNLEGVSLENQNLSYLNLGEINLKGCNLKGANLKGANLHKTRLIGADLQQAELQGANLHGVFLQESNLQGATLQSMNQIGINMQNAKLQKANLKEINLQGVNLQGAKLQMTNLELANLQGANLKEVDLRGARLCLAKMDEAILQGANLEGADLRGAKLKMVNLTKADLKDASLGFATLEKAKLQNAKLEGANFYEANLIETNLQGAYLAKAVFLKAKFEKTSLERAIMFEAILQGVNLQRANLSEAELKRANLAEARLQEADLHLANLTEAVLQQANLIKSFLKGAFLKETDLREAKLQGADLREAKLQGADLREAKLQGADLENANLMGAIMIGADLKGTNLQQANIESASFDRANLSSVDMKSVKNWKSISIKGARISKVLNAPIGFLDWAKINGANINDFS